MDAADSADASAIAALLGEGATLTVDAGAHAAWGASTPTVCGPTTAVQLLSVLDSIPDRTLTLTDINGDAGILIHSDGRVAGVIAVEVRAHVIAHVWAIVNPDKLAHWNRT
jgi:RNA polymerase sigma-70 factor (ECF subfamily)